MNHYKMNFALMQFHGYKLADLNDMLPYERMIYIDMIQAHTKNENDRKAEQEAMYRIARGKR